MDNDAQDNPKGNDKQEENGARPANPRIILNELEKEEPAAAPEAKEPGGLGATDAQTSPAAKQADSPAGTASAQEPSGLISAAMQKLDALLEKIRSGKTTAP